MMKYFLKISARSPDDIRRFIGERDPANYSLVDVRQQGEYLLGHLPGAKLIPLHELVERLGELDPLIPTIVYCASGIRSRAAASILRRAGFLETHVMEGGIQAWQGMIVDGVPETGVTWFASMHTTEEIIALAWVLEDGMCNFYREMAVGRGQDVHAKIFSELSAAEKHHKDALVRLFRQLTGKVAGNDFPEGVLQRFPKGKIMEGGMNLVDALSWARGKDTGKILEMAISLESQAFDRLLVLRDAFDKAMSREVFGLLAAEEKSHLEKLNDEFRKYTEERPG